MTIKARDTFGWNGNAWRTAFESSILIKEASKRKNLKILEVGAGRHSQVAYEFDNTSSEITIGYYLRNDKVKLVEHLDYMSRVYRLESNYKILVTDLFLINDHYDIIIMKSVLGGVFRNNFSVANSFCEKIVQDNLNAGGILISVDNGKSLFEPVLKNFGARKNKWHYLVKKDLYSANEQTCFGFFSSFALSTRLGGIGAVIEYILYVMDRFIYQFQKSNHTVICSVFKKDVN